MKQADYRKAIADYIRVQARPPDKFSHQPRLYRLARELAEGAAYDDDVLYAAAWLHDLGVFVGHRPEDPVALATWDHLAYAIREVPPLLAKMGFPGGKVAAVCEVIRTHLPHAQPTSFEGELLHDADIIEQLGAMGVLRTVSKIGRDTRFVHFQDAVRVLRRNAEELPGCLRLDSARRLAGKRRAVLVVFLDAVAAEAAEDER